MFKGGGCTLIGVAVGDIFGDVFYLLLQRVCFNYLVEYWILCIFKGVIRL
jgi:hypothetical protein